MAAFERTGPDGEIAAALQGIRSRLETLASITAENILAPGEPQEQYHQLLEEAYAALGLIETQVDELGAELEYQHKRLDEAREAAFAAAIHHQERESPADAQDDLESRLPPLVGRIQVAWRGERFVFILPDGQELAYTPEELDPIYTTLYKQRAWLAGASFSILPTPDRSMQFRVSGEAAVQLLAQLRDLRHEQGIPEPPDNPWFSGEERTS